MAQNHAYSVLYCKEVGRGLKFLKVRLFPSQWLALVSCVFLIVLCTCSRGHQIRNPWGHGEWHGDWSDGWSGWGEHPDVEAALADDPQCAFRRGDDGVFWMVRVVLHCSALGAVSLSRIHSAIACRGRYAVVMDRGLVRCRTVCGRFGRISCATSTRSTSVECSARSSSSTPSRACGAGCRLRDHTRSAMRGAATAHHSYRCHMSRRCA